MCFSQLTESTFILVTYQGFGDVRPIDVGHKPHTRSTLGVRLQGLGHHQGALRFKSTQVQIQTRLWPYCAAHRRIEILQKKNASEITSFP